jgi:predicted DNA-binding protein
MVNITNRSRYFLDIDPELRNRVKAVAALYGKTMREWLTEAIIEKLEDDIDAREGLAALGDKEGTVSLRDYLNSQKDIRRV